MDQRDSLPVLREESAVGNVHQLQDLGIVVQLHGDGINVLSAGNQQVDGEGVPFRRLYSGRVKQETGRGSRGLTRIVCPCLRLAGRCLIGRSRSDRRQRLTCGYRLRLAGHVAQPDRGGSADIDGSLVDFLHIGGANDMRHDGEDDLVLGMILRGLAEQVLQNGNLRQARYPAQRFRLLVFHDSAQQVSFAIFQADLMFDFALTNDGLADAADVLLSGNSGNVHQDLESDFAIGMHMRRDIDIDADIQILELRIDQRVDTHPADAGLERSSRDRHTVANLQRSLLPVQRANLRILNKLGVALAQYCGEIGGRNGDLEIGGVQVAQRIQADAIAR